MADRPARSEAEPSVLEIEITAEMAAVGVQTYYENAIWGWESPGGEELTRVLAQIYVGPKNLFRINPNPMADRTIQNRNLMPPAKPGEVRNPFGRPKGSRNKLGELFVEKMHADFLAHGKSVIEQVRIEKPDQYLKVIASILPKELHVKDVSLDDMSDADVIEMLATIRALTGQSGNARSADRSAEAEGSGGAQASEGDPGPSGRPH